MDPSWDGDSGSSADDVSKKKNTWITYKHWSIDHTLQAWSYFSTFRFNRETKSSFVSTLKPFSLKIPKLSTTNAVLSANAILFVGALLLCRSSWIANQLPSSESFLPGYFFLFKMSIWLKHELAIPRKTRVLILLLLRNGLWNTNKRPDCEFRVSRMFISMSSHSVLSGLP